MSKLFFDDLLDLGKVETEIKKAFPSKEEREESESLVDHIIHDKVMEKILDKLPPDYHIEFLELYHKCPHDEVVIFEFLRGKTGKDIEKELQQDLKDVSSDILRELKSQDEISTETGVSKK
ncbi:hypothetical protein A2208_03190 [Candidatus Woesebacteria bacterium RIFOXYA1_FULL_43_16]|nr:MAG: hypothetical protein A2208_03190 [Candidatus Woesebacteria bacterium RIFOXYA1_FULL_43_16]